MQQFFFHINILIALFSFCSKAAAQDNQAVNSGGATSPINFPGAGCVYSWVNTIPGIGLAASGTGNIPSFIAVNKGPAPVTAIITGLPVNMGAGCNGTLITYSITVNPTSAISDTIKAGTATGMITACAGTASSSPNIRQFTVSGSGLTGNITATAPAGFEISLSAASGYSSSVTLTEAGDSVSSTIVYVHSSASAPPGSITGNVVLTSPGAASQSVAVVGTVNPLPTVNPVANQMVNNGAATTSVNFTGNANTFNWVNDTPGIGLAASGTGNIASFTAVNTGSSPVTATITVTPLSTGYAYIANSISNSVSVINTATNLVVSTIPVGQNPTGLSVSPDGKAVYVANQRSNSISVISTATNMVTATITTTGQSPTTIAVSPDGKYLYVVNLNSNSVSVISTTTNVQVAAITVGGYPVCVAVSPDGNTVYVVNSSNSISVIDASTNMVKTTIPVNNSPYGIAVSPDGSKLYVSVLAANTAEVINTADYSVIATIPVAPSPAGIAITPDGRFVYLCDGNSGTVSVISTTANAVVQTIGVGANPAGISVSPDGRLVFAANEQSNTVSVISTAANTVTATVNVGQYPLSLGNFVTGGTGCTGTPVSFKITVNQASLSPQIMAKGSYSSLTTVYGTPSPSENFLVSGANLTAGILITAPAGFQVSTDDINFSAAVTTGGAGDINAVPVYIRLAATTPAGVYNEAVKLSSSGASDFGFEFPTSTVTQAALTVTADDKTKIFESPNPVFEVTYTGFVNNDGPAQLTALPTIITTAVTASPPGQYPIIASGAVSVNYGISYVNGVLTIIPDTATIIIPNTFTPNGDGINDTWNIKNLKAYPNCTVNIYTRYGENIFVSVGYGIPWDGRYKGSYLPQGTYYYIIKPEDGRKILSGSVSIIR